MFSGAKNVYFEKYIYCSVRTKKLHNISFIKFEPYKRTQFQNSFSNFQEFFQFFSASFYNIFKKIKFFKTFFAPENMKKPTSKVAHNRSKCFFQYCQPAQNQPKSQFLFHKNCSLGDFGYMRFKDLFQWSQKVEN